MYKRFAIYIISFLIVFTILVNLDIDVSYADFKDYLQVLLTVSSMIFTVMGLWVAFLYPKAMTRLVDLDSENKSNPYKKCDPKSKKEKEIDLEALRSETYIVESLVESIMRSILVVLFIMLIFVAKIFLSETDLYSHNIEIIKALALSATIILSVLQVISIFQVMWSNYLFLENLHERREEIEGDNDF